MTLTQDVTRVLIVDDHRVVLWGLCKLLETARPDIELVAAVTTGEQAVAALHEHRPHIVLLDLDLGTANGIEFLPAMSEHASVIVLTGSRNVSADTLVVNGARGVILKSEPAEVILKAIGRVRAGETWVDRLTISRLLKAATTRKDSPAEELTHAERKVVAAVLQHKSAPNKVIADALHISDHTLRNHLSKIYSKLGMRRRIDLVLYASQMMPAATLERRH